jgi:hypothetical protein
MALARTLLEEIESQNMTEIAELGLEKFKYPEIEVEGRDLCEISDSSHKQESFG